MGGFIEFVGKSMRGWLGLVPFCLWFASVVAISICFAVVFFVAYTAMFAISYTIICVINRIINLIYRK